MTLRFILAFLGLSAAAIFLFAAEDKDFSGLGLGLGNLSRFEKDLKVTIQALGWRSGGRHLPLQDDIASVAFWYQQEPHAQFPNLPDKDSLEIN